MVYVIWIALSLLAFVLYSMAPGELAPAEDQGVIFGIVEAGADATIDQTSFYTDAVGKMFKSIPEKDQSFQLTMPSSGFSGMVLKPWGERKRTAFQILPEAQAMVNKVPGIRLSHGHAVADSRRRQFSGEFCHCPPPPSRRRFCSSRSSCRQIAATNGMFAFPPIIDTKIDQPEMELVIDRDKVAALGLDLQSVGSDLAALVGGNYVNRFSLAGRSYKVIPQLQRIERLNADQLGKQLRAGPERKTDSRQHVRAF